MQFIEKIIIGFYLYLYQIYRHSNKILSFGEIKTLGFGDYKMIRSVHMHLHSIHYSSKLLNHIGGSGKNKITFPFFFNWVEF